jgi:hypothetical protein
MGDVYFVHDRCSTSLFKLFSSFRTVSRGILCISLLAERQSIARDGYSYMRFLMHQMGVTQLPHGTRALQPLGLMGPVSQSVCRMYLPWAREVAGDENTGRESEGDKIVKSHIGENGIKDAESKATKWRRAASSRFRSRMMNRRRWAEQQAVRRPIISSGRISCRRTCRCVCERRGSLGLRTCSSL